MSIHSTQSPSPAPIVRGPKGRTYETNPTGKAGMDMRQGNPPPSPGPKMTEGAMAQAARMRMERGC